MTNVENLYGRGHELREADEAERLRKQEQYVREAFERPLPTEEQIKEIAKHLEEDFQERYHGSVDEFLSAHPLPTQEQIHAMFERAKRQFGCEGAE